MVSYSLEIWTNSTLLKCSQDNFLLFFMYFWSLLYFSCLFIKKNMEFCLTGEMNIEKNCRKSNWILIRRLSLMGFTFSHWMATFLNQYENSVYLNVTCWNIDKYGKIENKLYSKCKQALNSIWINMWIVIWNGKKEFSTNFDCFPHF